VRLAPALFAIFLAGALFFLEAPARADDGAIPAPPARLTLEIAGGTAKGDLAAAIKIALALTALSLAPAILIAATSFVRIAIVLGFVRTALSTPAQPPNQVLIGLSLALTLFAMKPTLDEVYASAAGPYVRGELELKAALARAEPPLRAFLLRHTRERALSVFLELGRIARPEGPSDVPIQALLPAFVTSELTTAFEMGVFILVPFLVIDFVVSSVLLAMGMIMLPPATVATPMKILLFVLVDGWNLIVRSLLASAG
jgi:flagellar biosynthetic protein FliP